MLNVIRNRVDQMADAVEGPTTNPLVGDLAKPTFHQIQPRTARWNEVDVKPWMSFQPRLDLGMFVRVVVVHDQVQVQTRWRPLLDQLKELDPLLMAMGEACNPR